VLTGGAVRLVRLATAGQNGTGASRRNIRRALASALEVEPRRRVTVAVAPRANGGAV